MTRYLLHLFTAIALLISSSAEAYDFKDSNNICYNLNTNDLTAEIVRSGTTSVEISTTNPETIQVTIPETIEVNSTEYTVTGIADFGFDGWITMSEVSIPKTVTTIGESALAGCSVLVTVTVDDQNPVYKDGGGNCIIETSTNTLVAGCKGTTIPEGVKTIAAGAFYACWGLAAINIPRSVKSIGANAFTKCTSLTTITVDAQNGVYKDGGGNCIIEKGTNTLVAGCIGTTIPEGVTAIGDNAFYQCSGLTSVTIPEGVTAIGDNAFYSCSGLTSINIPSSVASIGNQAFEGCIKLTTITVDDANTVYDDGGSNCIIKRNTKTLILGCAGTVIPSSVEIIGEYAFYKSKITSISIPSSVKSIAPYAFANCSLLTAVAIPSSVTLIGNYAFKSCTKVTTLVLPDGVENIGKGAFSSLKMTEVHIPSTLKTINDSTFYKCTGLTYIIIPKGVKEIGSNAFYGCSALARIYIPSTLESIGEKAFYGCVKAASVTSDALTPPAIASNSFNYIGSKKLYVQPVAGEGNNNIYSVTDIWKDFGSIIEGIGFMDDLVKSICINNWDTNEDGGLSFNEAAAVTVIKTVFTGTSITSFNEFQYFTGVTSIGNFAFYGCSGLTSVIIPESVKTIGDYAFRGCTNLTSITIPEGVTTIGDKAFYLCSGLTAINIPSGVGSIGDQAFCSCSGLTSITVDDTNTVYEDGGGNCIIETNSKTLIQGCVNTVIPEDVTTIGDKAFYKCHSLTSITIPEGVTSIGDNAFYYCTNLTAISIPEGVTTIGSNAFDYCTNLTAISIPEGVTTIGSNAFDHCTNLTSVTVYNPTPVSIGSETFSSRTNATLYVPAGSKAAYAAAEPWNQFMEIVEMEAPGIATDINEALRMQQEESVNDVWYDLSGRKVSKNNVKNGIYIVKGRKIFVK